MAYFREQAAGVVFRKMHYLFSCILVMKELGKPIDIRFPPPKFKHQERFEIGKARLDEWIEMVEEGFKDVAEMRDKYEKKFLEARALERARLASSAESAEPLEAPGEDSGQNIKQGENKTTMDDQLESSDSEGKERPDSSSCISESEDEEEAYYSDVD